ncbi:MAG TPA: phospholipase D-like domain-containing protein [Bacteroidia bacterium]|nr:phospholipase D-like domain-containing protein [Bacteroidia bacterium]
MKKFLTLVSALIAFSVTGFSQVNIQAARQAAINSTVTIRGIVTNGAELGTIRYVQDSSAGIALYDAALSGVQRGDSIVATGTLTSYDSLLEVQPVSTHTVVTTGNTLPAPVVLTPSQIGEAVEGELVRVNNATFQTGGTFAGNTSYTFTSNSQSGTVYVRTGSPLVGAIIPTGYVSIIGVASQYFQTYQLLPRDTADLISNSSISIITPLTQSNMTASGFNISWNTNITGSTYVLYGRTPALELGMLSGASGLTHTVTVSGANPSDIFYVKAYSVNGSDTAFSATRAFATVSASSGRITVYFDKSVDTTLSTGVNATLLFHTIDDTIAAYINRAKYTIDIAMYSFDNTNIVNLSTALNNAYSRGVRVRVIYDGSQTTAAVSQLNPNIPIVYSPTTSAYNIMHNKFMIIDALSTDPGDPLLWTGSTNWTDNQTGTDANNVIIFQDQSIAKGYKIEFDEMWGDTGMVPNAGNSRFGPYKTDNTPHEYLIGGHRVEQYFSPSDGTNQQIVNHLGTANTDLCIATMIITRSDLAYAITGASSSGVQTYVMVDDQTTTTVWPTLSAALPAGHLVDYSANGIMHHKYAIIDPNNVASDPMVMTGSHNWSTTADTKNDENMVIVHDDTIANIYYQEFHPRFTQNGGTIIGIETADQNAPGFRAWPNPSMDVCNIGFTLTSSENVSVTVTDISGNIISTSSVAGMTGYNTTQIGTGGLPAGIYFVHVTGATVSSTCRIVVGH